MENTKLNNIAWKLTNENRGYTSETLIAVLYKYFHEKIDSTARYIEDADEIVDRTFGKEKSYYDYFQIIDEVEWTISDFEKLVETSIDRYESSYGFKNYSGGNTPDQIAHLVANLFEIENGDSIFDEGSGNGSAIVRFHEVAKSNNKDVSLSGMEINLDRAQASAMYLEMLGVNADILQGDALKAETLPAYNKAYVFPPFGMIYSSDSDDYLSKKFGTLFNFRTNSEWMFVFRALDSLADKGRLISVLPLGSLFRTNGKEIRKYLVENNLIEGIIVLPPKVLFETNIPVAILVLGNGSKNIKLVDATEMVIESDKKNTVELDTDKIFESYKTIEPNIEYDEILQYDYSLNPNLYLGEEQEIPYATKLSEICELEIGSQYTLARFKDRISAVPTEYQILTSSDIQNGLVDFDSLTYVLPDEKLKKFALKENDIVVTSKSTKVKSFVARNLPNRNVIVTGGMIVLHPDTEKVDPTFLKMFLDSETGAQLMQRIMQGTVIKTLSMRDFKNLEVSCPPIEEQHKYSQKYNSLLAMYSAVSNQLSEIQAELDSFYEDKVQKEAE